MSLAAWIRRHALIAFFVLSYVIMFGAYFGTLYVVTLPPNLVWFLGAFSPTISAVIVSWIIGGLPEVKRLLSGFTRWKVSAWWYLAALSLFLLPLAIAGVYILLGNPIPGLRAGTTALALLGQFVFTAFSGPISEEAGWRGFALPRMQSKNNALVSSLILGVIWTCWHIPLFFTPGTSQSSMSFPIYLALVVSQAIFMTWLWNNTRGSLIITVLAHFAFNLDGGFIMGTLGLLPPNVFYMTAGPGLFLMVVAVVVIFGPKYLSRKPVSELPFQRKA